MSSESKNTPSSPARGRSVEPPQRRRIVVRKSVAREETPAEKAKLNFGVALQGLQEATDGLRAISRQSSELKHRSDVGVTPTFVGEMTKMAQGAQDIVSGLKEVTTQTVALFKTHQQPAIAYSNGIAAMRNDLKRLWNMLDDKAPVAKVMNGLMDVRNQLRDSRDAVRPYRSVFRDDDDDDHPVKRQRVR